MRTYRRSSMRPLSVVRSSAAVLVLFSANVARADGPIVAVFGVEDRTGQFTPGDLDQLTNYLSTSIAQGDTYRVVPPSQIRSRLRREKTESYRDCYDEKCQIEIGREVAAEKVLSSKVVQVGTRCAVLLTLYDLRKAATDASASQKATCTKDEIVAALDRGVVALKSKSEVSAHPAASQPEQQRQPPSSGGKVTRQRVTGLWLGGAISLGVLYLSTIAVTAGVCDEEVPGVDCGKAIGYSAIPVFGPIPALADSSLQSTDGEIAGLVVSLTFQIAAASALIAGLIYKRSVLTPVALGSDDDRSWLSFAPVPLGRGGWGLSLMLSR